MASAKIIRTTIVRVVSEVIDGEIRNCQRDGGSWNNHIRLHDNSVTVRNVELFQGVHINTRSQKIARSQE